LNYVVHLRSLKSKNESWKLELSDSYLYLTLKQRSDFCNVNRGVGCKSNGTDWNFIMRFSPTGIEPKHIFYGASGVVKL